MGSDVRRPLVAGTFYPGDRDGLQKALGEWQLSDRGAEGSEDGFGLLESACGIIVPHAGYMYSGHVAACGVRWLAKRGVPDRVVILGADHTGIGVPVCTDDHDAWHTPLGDAPIDRDACRLLADAGIGADRTAFVREHSVEVVLPFLQAAFGAMMPFVPIRVGTAASDTYARLGELLAGVVGDHGALVVSSDFTHYESEDVATHLDHEVLDRICAIDRHGLEDLISSKHLSVCGIPSILTALHWSETVGIREGHVLQYATSGDVTGDRGAVVGYAAVGLGWR